MPLAPNNYRGNALIIRPFYYYKSYWISYGFTSQPKILKSLDPTSESEVLRINTFQIEHSKDQYMDVYSYDDNRNKSVKQTYYYDAKLDLYSNIQTDEYIYFIQIW